MSGQNPPFNKGVSYYVATSNTSTTTAVVPTGETALVTNLSTANLYCNFDAVGLTLTVGAGYLVLPNAQRVIPVGSAATKFTAILDSSTTGHAYVECGNGSAH